MRRGGAFASYCRRYIKHTHLFMIGLFVNKEWQSKRFELPFHREED